MGQIKSKLNSIIPVLIVIFLAGIAGYFLGASSRGVSIKSSPHPTPIKQVSNYPNSYQNLSKKGGLYPVSEVIDGDTIRIAINGKEELVRFLGINTPEVENKYRHQECFGPEASKETKKLLTGKKVYVLPDPKVPNRGKYNRLLRYIFLPNGEFINADLVKNGYAFEYIYQPFQFMKYFNLLEKEARKNRLGLWSNKCDYYFK